MPEPNTEDPTPEALQHHQLLTLLTVINLNLGLLQREMDQDGTRASARMRLLVGRIAQAQQAVVAELRASLHNG